VTLLLGLIATSTAAWAACALFVRVRGRERL
jgi:hypothetical protein